MAMLRLVELILTYSRTSSGSDRRCSQSRSPVAASIRLDHVVRVRHVHHAVVHQRRPLLAARRQRPGPDQPQVCHVVPVDLIQRTVAPAVRGPPPTQPVGGIRVAERRVRDGHEGAVTLTLRRRRHAQAHAEQGYPPDGMHSRRCHGRPPCGRSVCVSRVRRAWRPDRHRGAPVPEEPTKNRRPSLNVTLRALAMAEEWSIAW